MKDISAQSFRNSHTQAAQLLELREENFAHNSILMSLCTNRRSDLYFKETEASGWWADALTPADELGSSLFTLSRAKPSDETLDLALFYAQEGLKWMKNSDPQTEIEIGAHFEAQELKLSIDLRGSHFTRGQRFEVIL